MLDILFDTILDTLKTLPFLFAAYLVMEYIEHHAGEKMTGFIKNSRFAPAVGAACGVFPQCGFSASAAGLFSGGVITPGTLIAVFLATSDEMLPILISQGAPYKFILKVLLFKLIAAIVAGYVTDTLFMRRTQHSIHDICHDSNCHCEEHEGVLTPALIHTGKIALFIVVINLVLNCIIDLIGMQALAGFILNKPIIGNVLSGVIGLIPNCAASIVVTELYLSGAMSAGAMLSGLFVGAGIGLAVLYKSNKDIKENLRITAALYVSGVLLGSLIGVLPIW